MTSYFILKSYLAFTCDDLLFDKKSLSIHI